MIRYRHGLLFAIVALSGCQTMSGLFQNRFASTPEYSTEEMLALSQPLSASSSPELGQGVVTAGTNAANANPVSLASYNSANTPQQAGRMSSQSLVEAGQQAIRDAGTSNPAGLQQARQLFEQALGMDATNSDAHHGIAIVADLQKDWMAAEQHYKQALSGDSSNPSLLNDLGYSYLLQSRYHEAQQYLNQAIQISPKHERAHLNLALLSLRRGNTPAAQQTLAKIYSQQEIGSNLIRLQQDLLKLNADSGAQGGTYAGAQGNNGFAPAGLPQNSSNAVYPVSQSQQPSDWNANRPAAGGIQRYTDAGGSMAIDPALRVTDSQPVSLYPPGVVREEVTAGQVAQQNAGFQSGQPMPQNGAQAMANAGYPNQQFGNPQLGSQQLGGQPSFQAFPAGNPNGLQMPGANNASQMTNQYPIANSQSSANQFNSGFGGGMNPQGGFESSAMGLNVGPGMPFPVGGAAGLPPQQTQLNSQFQNTAQPLLNQYHSGSMEIPGAGFGQVNTGQANYGQMSQGQLNVGQANYGQVNPSQANYGQLQQEISQLPPHRQPSAEMQNGQQPMRQMNTQPVSYGQPVAAPSSFGQANYGQPGGMQNQGAGQFPAAYGSGANPAAANYGQPMYPNAQSQNSSQGLNSGMGSLPGGMPQAGMPATGMPATGMSQGMNPNPFNGGMQQGGPMQQFEQQQMNRINDQYQQALQQMNGRGFPGQ